MRKLATITALSAAVVGAGLAVASTVSAGSTTESFGTITKMTTSFSNPTNQSIPVHETLVPNQNVLVRCSAEGQDIGGDSDVDPGRPRRPARLRARQHDRGQRSRQQLLTRRARFPVTPAHRVRRAAAIACRSVDSAISRVITRSVDGPIAHRPAMVDGAGSYTTRLGTTSRPAVRTLAAGPRQHVPRPCHRDG